MNDVLKWRFAVMEKIWYGESGEVEANATRMRGLATFFITVHDRC
jgi:hypothetical protein